MSMGMGLKMSQSMSLTFEHPPARDIILNKDRWEPIDFGNSKARQILFLEGHAIGTADRATEIEELLLKASDKIQAEPPFILDVMQKIGLEAQRTQFYKTNAHYINDNINSRWIIVGTDALNEARRMIEQEKLRAAKPTSRKVALKAPFSRSILQKPGLWTQVKDDETLRQVNLATIKILAESPYERKLAATELMRMLSGIAHVRNERGTNTAAPQQEGDIITAEAALIEDTRARMERDARSR